MTSIQEPNDRWAESQELEEDLPPFVSGLAGKSRAENEAHIIARVALIKRLVADPSAQALFARWTAQTQFGQALVEGARCWERLDEVAMRIGFASWAEVEAHANHVDMSITIETEPGDNGVSIQQEIEAAMADAALAAEQLDIVLANLDESDEFDRLFDEAKAFVRGAWAQTWPWMTWMLVEHWSWLLIAAFGRTSWTHRFWLAAPEDAPIPPFETLSGESIGSALTRFEQLIQDALSASKDLPSGYRANPEEVERFVYWWYRRNIRGESKRRIARDYAAERGREDDCRKHVGYGIRRAQELLDVVNWHWRDTDAA